MPPQQHSLTLANGLPVQLHHVPHLKQAAAFLRVHAGSHDVPAAWPGLAHFLEHLFFLGGQRFSGDEALMPFVQRNGGQLNASTRERCTDFFFELPPASFAAGLERLCDMLAHPRLGAAEQLREREVLHAEFIAWSRDAQARHDLWLIQPLNPAHPLRAFHAGNRYSLRVPSAAFQQALREFYQGHYQTGQMSLCLVGPQPLAHLQALAERATTALPPGPGQVQAPAPPLRGELRQAGAPRPDASRLDLLFACQASPRGMGWALEFLATWVASGHDGGLLAELRQRGWAQSLQLKTHYRFADQLLLSIALGGTRAEDEGAIAARVFDWLQAFAAHDDWPTLREESALLRERRRQVAGALELARGLIEPDAHDGPADGLPALRELLAQLRPEALLHPVAAAPDQPLNSSWRLPPRNRFLRGTRSPGHVPPWPSALAWQAGPPGPLAGLRLRWRLAARAPEEVTATLQRALAGVQAEAEQAGVKLRLHCHGRDWTLECGGAAAALPSVVASAVTTLRQPPASAWQAGSTPPVLVPIRQLLALLAEHVDSGARASRSEDGPAALASAWAGARWDGLVLGLAEAERPALAAALQALPGRADASATRALASWAQWRQVQVPTPSSEHALLLFCPAPAADLADEAAWRLLAQLLQAPFYQRLRVQLQLGYAVFSGWRQLAGRGGLLFGVQSPGTPVAALLEHIETFIAELPALLAELPDILIKTQAEDMAGRFNLHDMELERATEWLWQAHLAGRGGDYPAALQAALQAQNGASLQAAGRQLIDGNEGRLLLANARVDAPRWLSQG
ncbi:pyrroloquinoline quinone biosynthesis protein PqqF [Pseudomonas sp. HR96]|uniref:pyrroloquinoline quinone biosynthesis protein PqqF n=1 Tax=Pseudomonas sp. HR96 TaxID=1027966 RepID=UPI002A751275|nr:pyrroloquinoline quinone biosynthesis protein PqqF [Pseudomonas sp. HR96]WPP00340.1 pyrroloquinoline quinone biosynthesis protein PqqF [Pseudomonas sp. HR96]